MLIWAALPQELRSITRPIAAKDYWTASPLKRWITTEVFNAVYVERERKGDEDPLAPLIAALESGDSLILFPEGTRGHEEDPQPFKSGLYNLAQRFPEVVGKGYSFVIESIGANPVDIVVDHSTYYDIDGRFWAAGTTSPGSKVR